MNCVIITFWIANYTSHYGYINLFYFIHFFLLPFIHLVFLSTSFHLYFIIIIFIIDRMKFLFYTYFELMLKRTVEWEWKWICGVVITLSFRQPSHQQRTNFILTRLHLRRESQTMYGADDYVHMYEYEIHSSKQSNIVCHAMRYSMRLCMRMIPKCI